MKSPETVLHLLWGFRDVISKLDQNSDKHELDKDMELALYGIRKHYDNKLIENIVIISNYGNDAIPPTTQVGTVLFVI